MHELTPRQIVEELDRYIIGQDEAKRAVAIAIRNRWRRQQLSEELRKEITPKNIVMIGPTGVGKTEIARRLSQLIRAPFVKVEATKYTEVGYHGRDVEGMIRELLETAINMVRKEERDRVEEKAKENMAERVLDLLVPTDVDLFPEGFESSEEDDEIAAHKSAERRERTRRKMRKMLDSGQLDDRVVELTTEQRAVPVQIFSSMGMEQMDLDFQNMFEKIVPKQTQHRRMTVKEARRILLDQEVDALLDREKISQEAVDRCEQSGIIFVDEIDKICGPDSSHGPDVSRQGVQRDLLPIVEGTTVVTRHGSVRTDHILFVAAGAFHKSKPSDLMPELQGRFPIRVELEDLGRDDFLRILKEPKNSLIRQYQALLGADEMDIHFTDDAIEGLADFAFKVNKATQNIGARRLHTLMERLVEVVSFDAPDLSDKTLLIDANYVRERLVTIVEDEDLSRFIL